MADTQKHTRWIRYYDSKERRTVEVLVEVEVDWESLAQTLGPKALRNKTRTTRLQAGVKVSIPKVT